MLAGFLCIALINVYQILSFYAETYAIIIGIATFILMFAGILKYIILYKTEEKNLTEPYLNDRVFAGLVGHEEISENKEFLLQRRTTRKEIIEKVNNLFTSNKAKGIVLTGESGAGKSILLNFLYEDFSNLNYDVYSSKDYNSIKLELNAKTNKTIIVFDQFEKSLLPNANFEQWINSNREFLRNCVFIFSFPQDYITSIFNKIYSLDKDFYLETYILRLNDEEVCNYIEKISRFSGESEDEIKNLVKKIENDRNFKINNKIELLCSELIKVKNGERPLIEMEFLAEIMNKNLLNNISLDTDSFINSYFDLWVNKFNKKEIGYIILNLFTEYNSHSLSEIRTITFEKEDEFKGKGEIINLLFNNSFLTKYKANKKIEFKENEKDLQYCFEPKHSYISNVIRHYIANKEIPEGIKYYTEYFKKHNEETNYVKFLNKSYSNYHSKHSTLNIALYLLIIFLLFINVHSIIVGDLSLHFFIQRLLVTFSCFPSTFYLFNYCDKILLAKKERTVFPLYSIGFITVICSYIFLNEWGIFLGLEICLLALYILFWLTKNTVEQAHSKFKKDSIVFGIIGFIVVALGVIYSLYFCENIEPSIIGYFLKYSYYFLFTLYAFMSDVNHIKYNYILGRIGYLNVAKIK